MYLIIIIPFLAYPADSHIIYQEVPNIRLKIAPIFLHFPYYVSELYFNEKFCIYYIIGLVAYKYKFTFLKPVTERAVGLGIQTETNKQTGKHSYNIR